MNLIDVHHHFSPKKWLEKAGPAIRTATRNWNVPNDWTPQASLDQMERHGIAASILSLGTPGLEGLSLDDARAVARDSNEYLQNLVISRPRSFGSLAVLPLPHVDASLQEIAFVFDTLGVDGLGLLTNYGDLWPGDASLDPIFAELNARSAVVYFHPTLVQPLKGIPPGIPPSLIEFPMDTARAITNLLWNGTLSRHPNIRWIFSHCGGALPSLAGRISKLAEKSSEFRARVPEGTLKALGNLYFDVAGSMNEFSIAPLLNLVPIGQLLFGTDYPYMSVAEAVCDLNGQFGSAQARQAVARENALKLWPRLAM